MQTDATTNILTEEEIKKLFRTDIGHFSDKSARLLFKRTEHLRGLVMFLAENIAAQLDFSQAQIGHRSYINEALRDLMSDIVFTVPFRDKSNTDALTIYILIEHQSTVDRMMGFRFLSYMCQIWQAQLEVSQNEKVPATQRKLRPILPIVFYTGTRKWNVPVSLEAVMDVPELMTPFVPKFETLFLGLKDTDPEQFGQQDHPFGWLMTVLQKVQDTETPIDETLTEALTKLDTLSTEEAELHAHAMIYLSHLILSNRPKQEKDHLMQRIMKHTKNTEVENQIMTGAEALVQEGKIEGKAEGLQLGVIQAKREDLLKLLGHRFGEIPDTVTKKVSRIRSLTRLDSLFDQALTADTLDDIKWD